MLCCEGFGLPGDSGQVSVETHVQPRAAPSRIRAAIRADWAPRRRNSGSVAAPLSVATSPCTKRLATAARSSPAQAP